MPQRASRGRRDALRGRPGSLLYQTGWVVAVTFLAWFALIQRYSASRLAVFTFLTPLFGIAAGHVVLGDPLSPGFALAAALVILASCW